MSEYFKSFIIHLSDFFKLFSKAYGGWMDISYSSDQADRIHLSWVCHNNFNIKGESMPHSNHPIGIYENDSR